jgi:hypothetical protein
MIPTGGKINGCAERKAADANSENGLSTASEKVLEGSIAQEPVRR